MRMEGLRLLWCHVRKVPIRFRIRIYLFAACVLSIKYYRMMKSDEILIAKWKSFY